MALKMRVRNCRKRRFEKEKVNESRMPRAIFRRMFWRVRRLGSGAIFSNYFSIACASKCGPVIRESTGVVL
jgi:hypothetical protein